MDPLLRLEPAGHTDLDHQLAERPLVRDDVDVAGPDVGGPLPDALQLAVDIREVLPGPGRARSVVAGLQLRCRGLPLKPVLQQSVFLTPQLPLGLLVLPLLLTSSPGLLLLLVDLRQV